jgi:hypothetical protein
VEKKWGDELLDKRFTSTDQEIGIRAVAVINKDN